MEMRQEHRQKIRDVDPLSGIKQALFAEEKKWTDKIMIKIFGALLALMVPVLGFFLTRLVTNYEETVKIFRTETAAAVTIANTYTDKRIEEHQRELMEQKRIAMRTQRDVQRIADFLEFKFGMPRQARIYGPHVSDEKEN